MAKPTNLKKIGSTEYDVAIVGGGINGAAAAQELSAKGYRVLLVDKGDFGSGSSSRSSRLLHCGLRYLAPGTSPWEFAAHPSRLLTGMRMARLAIDARDEFIKRNPQRAQISKLHFPIFKGGSYSGWHVDVAFGILKIFNAGKADLNYRRIKGAEARGLPLVNSLRDLNQLESVACYDEYQIAWPERVTLELALDAQEIGADVRNYTRADLIRKLPDGWELSVADVETGESVVVNAKTVVNTAGIWIDQFLQKHRSGKNPKILGTKGSHIVVKLDASARGMGIATMNRKNEPFYCLPWGDLHYLGPTEIVYENDLDNIDTTEGERDWLLGEANHLFPKLNLTKKDVLFTWSGVRPLTWDEKLPRGNRNRVLHDLSEDGLDGIFAMTGGPLMTHRSAGEEIREAVEKHLKRAGHRPSSTSNRAPNYASDFPRGGDPKILQALKGLAGNPVWLHRLLEEEQAKHLSDIILRRSGLTWYQQLTDVDVQAIAQHAAAIKNWSPERTAREIENYRSELRVIQQATP